MPVESPVSPIQVEVQRAVAELKARVHAEDLRIARYIEEHPSESIADAKVFVDRFLSSSRHARYHWILRRWQRLLETRSAKEIAEIFRSGSDDTEELRSSAPFCGPELEALA